MKLTHLISRESVLKLLWRLWEIKVLDCICKGTKSIL